jgi:hypothetical protein
VCAGACDYEGFLTFETDAVGGTGSAVLTMNWRYGDYNVVQAEVQIPYFPSSTISFSLSLSLVYV